MNFDRERAQQQLLQFISDNYMVEIEEIPLDQSLIDEGIIDSFGLIEIATFLEQTFAIKIAESDMVRENFGSVLLLVNFAERKVSS